MAKAAALENSNVVILAHQPEACAGHVCPLHNRTDHHMRGWPQEWRGESGKMERICSHGIGHPDPDHMEARFRIDPEDAWVDGVHGCDGCCRTPEEEVG